MPGVLLQTDAPREQAQVVHDQVREGLQEARGEEAAGRGGRRAAENLRRGRGSAEGGWQAEDVQVLDTAVQDRGQVEAASRSGLREAQGEEGEVGGVRQGGGEGSVRGGGGGGGGSKDQLGRIAHSLQGLLLAQHPSPL